LRAFFSARRAARVAEALAVEFASGQHPADELMGSSLVAREPSRFVVRVFLGRRAVEAALGPPWERCVIVAVPREPSVGRPSTLEGPAARPYAPMIR
jgi:hypothetical protein